MCALAKHPEQRFATAQAMSLAVQQATAHLPPEQWMPITASGTHRGIPSWQQQAPATWSSRVQRVDPGQPSRGLPRPSEQPLDRYLEPQGGSTTVSGSSGQVQQQPAPKSKRGVWLALAGLAVAGAVVAVVVTQRSSDEPTVAAVDQPAPPSADKPVDPPSEPPTVAKTEPTAPPANQPKPTANDESEDSDESDELAEVEKQVREAGKQLPEKAKRQIEDAVEELENARKQAGAPVRVEADPVDDPAPPPNRSVWVESRTLQFPNWNPKKVDMGAFLRFALAEAKRVVPDAELTRVDVTGVTPDGYADLTLPTLASDHGDIDIRFISPSASKPDPKIPVGVPQQRLCEFWITAEPDGIEIRAMSKSNCKTKSVATPACGYAALWKKAAGLGAPGNAVAQIAYYAASMHDAPRWFFTIGFGHDVTFSKMFVGPGC